MKIIGVYGIYNRDSKKWYVGSSVRVGERWRTHLSQLRQGKHNGVKLQRAWNKYGEDVWDWIKLEIVSDVSILLDREQHWLDKLDSYTNGYNSMRFVDKSFLGIKQSPETITKRITTRRANDSYWHTEETKRKISETQRGVKKGPMSDEQKKKIAKTRKETMSDEEKKACGDRARGRIYTPEQLKNFSEAHKGYVHPQSQKDAISKAMKGRKKSKEHIRAGLITRREKGVKLSKKACIKYDIPFED
jgi:group I intron endonuclease